MTEKHPDNDITPIPGQRPASPSGSLKKLPARAMQKIKVSITWVLPEAYRKIDRESKETSQDNN